MVNTDKLKNAAEVLERVASIRAFLVSMLEDTALVEEDIRHLFTLVTGSQWNRTASMTIHGTIADIHKASAGLAFSIDTLSTLEKLLQGDYVVDGALDAHTGFNGAIDKLGLFQRQASGVAEGEGR